MPKTISRSPAKTASIVPQRAARPCVVDDAWLEDVSPFGLQGLRRESLQILKPDRVARLAATLALTGTRKQIQDDEFVARTLARHQGWVEEYEVVHLIERSLWISGRSDLVMTLTRNPSQIPDNPPPRIMQALTKAYALHPQATIWYGVPLFSDENNAQGLPIPMTADEVRNEHRRRISAAQEQAMRWRWAYRAALGALLLPGLCKRGGVAVARRVHQVVQRGVNYWKQARRDARLRARAAMVAHMEYCRTGRSWTEIPEHTTLLGQIAANGLTSANATQRFLSHELVTIPAAVTGLSASSMAVAHFIPTLFVPLTIVATDPFLFVELPNEPGKLRHLGHWYWQGDVHGKKKLHLHV